MKKVKALTLVEVMVAVTIFSLICVSLFAFLAGAFKIKRYVSVGKRNELKVRIALDELSRELQSSIAFYGDSRDFNGTSDKLTFYTIANGFEEEAVLRLNYFVQDNSLMRQSQSVYLDKTNAIPSKLFMFDELTFAYWDQFNTTWVDSWQQKNDLPAGFKIEQIISAKKYEKFIPLYHANMTKVETEDEEL